MAILSLGNLYLQWLLSKIGIFKVTLTLFHRIDQYSRNKKLRCNPNWIFTQLCEREFQALNKRVLFQKLWRGDLPVSKSIRGNHSHPSVCCMPNAMNLNQSGLHCSPRIAEMEKREGNHSQMHEMNNALSSNNTPKCETSPVYNNNNTQKKQIAYVVSSMKKSCLVFFSLFCAVCYGKNCLSLIIPEQYPLGSLHCYQMQLKDITDITLYTIALQTACTC